MMNQGNLTMKLIPAIATSMLAAGIAASTLAGPAIYKSGTLTIPSGALFTDSRQEYYQDIVLETDVAGNLTLVSAKALPKVTVETVVTAVEETPGNIAVSLTVSGYKSVPCTALQDAAINRSGTHFTVVLAESVLGPAESCIAIIDPFELEVPLDVSGLAAGEYTVDVNGTEGSFTLETDAP
jgi:hypothetical protein